tara:strand:+ start:894 stop:1184 length:291 start_codon:yes stop_codon:yes gene_type:complete
MTPDQQRQAKAKQAGGSKPKGQELTGALRSLLYLTLVACVATISILLFFGTGDKVQCGSGLSQEMCYLPGADWTGYAVMAAFMLVLVCFNFLSPKE